MKAANGYYIYINYFNQSGEKCQSIKGAFKIEDNNITLYGFSPICMEFSHKFSFESTNPHTLNASEQDDVNEYLKINPHYNTHSVWGREIIPIKLNYGEKYFNIYRPCYNASMVERSSYRMKDNKPFLEDYKDLPIMDEREYHNHLNQLEILVDDLQNVFKTVAPTSKNLSCYGHNIRNIIILACTEIDAMMKNILKKNGCPSKGRNYTTTDYVKLIDVLKLKEYKLSFRRYSDFSLLSPFINWNSLKPSESIKWYDDYNKIKHDREKNFKLATIENAINSVVAFAIVLISQFGYRNEHWNDIMSKVLEVSEEPQWDITDFYIPICDSDIHIQKELQYSI